MTHGLLTVSLNLLLPFHNQLIPLVPYGVSKSAATFAQTDKSAATFAQSINSVGSLRCLCCYFSQTDISMELNRLAVSNGLGMWPRILCGIICCMGSVLDPPLTTRFAYLFWIPTYFTVDIQQKWKYHATRVTYGEFAATFHKQIIPLVTYGVFKIYRYFSQTNITQRGSGVS